MAKAQSLLVRRVPIVKLSVDPSNLRRHTERSTEFVMACLRRYGQQKPIVVDSKGMVIAGHGVLEAAKRLGWTHIDAVTSTLAGVERVLYAIADNRAGELSEWDQEGLAEVLKNLDASDLADVGFSVDELQDIAPPDRQAEDDEAPEPLKVAVSKPGDLWTLGEHRLLCGDSTSLEHVQRVMGGERASLVATDPPYLVDYTGERPSKGTRQSGKDWSDVYHEIDIKDAAGFFRGLFTNVLAVLGEHAAIYCWHAHRRVGLIQRIWEELGILDHQEIIWVKPTSVLGRVFYHFRHEPCIMGWRQGSMPEHDNDHEFDSVWEIDWEGKSKIRGNEHPTQKPIEIFARPMRKHTAAGEVVFEPFSGSGSQIVAAEQLKRRCRAIEIEPVFVDVAVRRWQTLTGKTAVGEDGRSWADTARVRKVKLPKAA